MAGLAIAPAEDVLGEAFGQQASVFAGADAGSRSAPAAEWPLRWCADDDFFVVERRRKVAAIGLHHRQQNPFGLQIAIAVTRTRGNTRRGPPPSISGNWRGTPRPSGRSPRSARARGLLRAGRRRLRGLTWNPILARDCGNRKALETVCYYDSNVRIRVLFFGVLRDIVGRREDSSGYSRRGPAGVWFSSITPAVFPASAGWRASVVLALNQEFSTPVRASGRRRRSGVSAPGQRRVLAAISTRSPIHDTGNFFALTRDPIDGSGDRAAPAARRGRGACQLRGRGAQQHQGPRHALSRIRML